MVKAKIKELFAALKAVARAIKNQADTRAKPICFFIALAELSKPPTTPTTTPKEQEQNQKKQSKDKSAYRDIKVKPFGF